MNHHQAFDGVRIFLSKGFFGLRDYEICWEFIGSGWFAIHTVNIQIKQNVILEAEQQS